MRPSSAYSEGVAAGRWQDDPAQREALLELDRIFDALRRASAAGLRHRLLRAFVSPSGVPGLYLWGGVGRGKTFLVDLLVERLPIHARRRSHFHRFMGQVHARLAALRTQRDPLAQVAAEIAAQSRLLCLDEFFVSDIGDAMILARLLDRLFARGVTLVTTSNTPPAQLYRDGLQRARFLPAIALLQRHCHVLHLEGPVDYRLRTLTHAPLYHHPLGPDADAALQDIYRRLTADTVRDSEPLLINDRPIPVVDSSEGVAWFRFEALCEGARSVADYIELARDFHTVLLSDVPQLDAAREDAARRFVHLVDEFYDRNVNLVLSAAAPIRALYGGDKLRHEFQRIESRLIEMQSQQYLARAHRP